MRSNVVRTVVLLGMTAALLDDRPVSAAVGYDANVRPTEPGWRWRVEPHPAALGGWARDGVVLSLVLDHLERVVATVAWSEAPMEWLRVVGFDHAGARLLFSDAVTVTSNGLRQTQFLLDHGLEVTTIGIEVLDKEGWITAARAAQRAAVRQGVCILPYPDVGKPFPFVLVTVGGEQVALSSITGQIVVFYFWAPGALRAELAQEAAALNDLCERYGGRVEIIGVCVNGTQDLLESVAAELRMNWKQVAVGGEERLRDLWYEGSTVRGFPRWFVVDEGGILVLDSKDLRTLCATVESYFD